MIDKELIFLNPWINKSIKGKKASYSNLMDYIILNEYFVVHYDGFFFNKNKWVTI